LYLIGGAARAGKTLIAQRMLMERGIPYFCVDYFVSALDQGAPELGIQGESPTEPKTRKLWPRIVPMLRNIVEVEPAYTVEGDALSPRGVSELIRIYPDQIRAIFIGYATATPERKLSEIRTFSGGVNDWIQDHTDDYILALCSEMIEFSRFVQRECASSGLPYFDVSEEFQKELAQAYASLTECGEVA
jgi:putative acetyltransferase